MLSLKFLKKREGFKDLELLQDYKISHKQSHSNLDMKTHWDSYIEIMFNVASSPGQKHFPIS